MQNQTITKVVEQAALTGLAVVLGAVIANATTISPGPDMGKG